MKLMTLMTTVLMASLLFGCTTPSKSSKMTNLVWQEGSPVAAKKDILADLSRTVYIQKEVTPANFDTNRTEVRPNRPMAASTRTWVRIYPYTEPLLRAQASTMFKEKAFKEKWSDEKLASEEKNYIAKATESFTKKAQCFGLEINTSRSKALQLKYWYGKLEQSGEEQDLTFSKGTGFSSSTKSTIVTGGNGVYAGTTSTYTKYFFLATVCSKKPIDMANEFKLKIEPRYELKLLPFTMSWLPPKN